MARPLLLAFPFLFFSFLSDSFSESHSHTAVLPTIIQLSEVLQQTSGEGFPETVLDREWGGERQEREREKEKERQRMRRSEGERRRRGVPKQQV